MNKQGKCPVVQGQDYEVSITDLGTDLPYLYRGHCQGKGRKCESSG